LSGIPPLAGFWGKLTLLTSALGQAAGAPQSASWFVTLAVVAAVNAAIAAGYYLRVIGVLYFRSTEPGSVDATAVASPRIGLAGVAALACVVLVVLIGLMPGRVVRSAAQAATAAGHRDGSAITSQATAAKPEDAPAKVPLAYRFDPRGRP
jgi:NADH-quinone oxidoreductase subunit N